MTHRNWPTLRLGEIALIIMGQSPPGETYNTEGGGIPLINGPAEYGPVHPVPVQWTSMPTRLCETGDILFCVRGNTTGRMNWADQQYCIGRGIAAIRGRNGASATSFLRYLLEYLKPDLYGIAIAGGSTFPNINATQLSNREAAIPPLPEQRAIAHILRTVQTAREARQHEVSLERERKAALMAHLFTHGTRGEPTKQTPIGEMPASWDIRSLGELSQVMSGGTPSRTEPAYWGGDIPWVKTGEIDYGTIEAAEETITEEGLQNSSARIIPAGTLLMAMYGQGITRGRVAILGIDAAINQACAAIFISRDELLTDYAFHYLAYSYESIRNLGHGANQRNLNAMLVRSIPIASPPTVDEQREVAEVLCACDAKIAALERESALLDELFRALLEELMTGRVSVAGMSEHDG